MSGSKHFDKVAWAVTALILVVTVLFMNGASLGLQSRPRTMGYEERLFDRTRVHTIDIVMDDWDTLIANATTEEYYTAGVVIDGEVYKNIGIRGKGNTSLSNVASMDSDRYSFKLEFDHYDSSISYHGLDKLSLNNLIQDNTMMKDYLTYTMMDEFGVHAPLCSFVYITVNGEDWGLYLAVEGVEDSFLERNYGADYGELYKPDSMSFGGGRGNGRDFNMEEFMNRQETAESTGETPEAMPQRPIMPGGKIPAVQEGEMPEMEAFDPDRMKPVPDMEGFGGEMPDMSQGVAAERPSAPQNSGGNRETPGGGMGASDVKLQYIDDNAESYANIWDNAKTDITEADQARLMEALKKLSAGEDLQSVVDIQQVIRYFVVHNYVCNGDSYTGNMIHNYYLHEENGQLSMIPWDYNLAFGTFHGGDAQSTVNTPVDNPVSGGDGSDRPMWSWILSDESYTALYHQYFGEFLDTVDIAEIIDNAYTLISSYVEKDPTKFCTFDEFETGVTALKQFCDLRTQSVTEQLVSGQTTQTMDYADASDLVLSDMGTMGMGGGHDRFSEEQTEDFVPAGMPGGFAGERPGGFSPPSMTDRP